MKITVLTQRQVKQKIQELSKVKFGINLLIIEHTIIMGRRV